MWSYSTSQVEAGLLGYLCSWGQTPAEAWEGVRLDVVFTQPADGSSLPMAPGSSPPMAPARHVS